MMTAKKKGYADRQIALDVLRSFFKLQREAKKNEMQPLVAKEMEEFNVIIERCFTRTNRIETSFTGCCRMYS
ncbi:hypothetical protein [Mangrovivirga cuniculi]